MKIINDYVVLLHGIRRDARIMSKLEQYLRQLGYDVVNETYPSTVYEIEELAEQISRHIQRVRVDASKKIHFVTHSMGSIIARVIMERFRPQNVGRVVMLAPPNKGSEVAEFLQKYKFYVKLFGPAGLQLGTGKKAIIHRLGKVDYELGIIAGARTTDPIFSLFLLPSRGDGKVTIESTKIEGMADHIIIPASHAAIPKKKETLRQVAYFLQHGKFDHK